MDDTTNTSGLIRRHRPLRPKREYQRPETPLCRIRLQIKAGDYDVIPMWSGKMPMKGWPHQPNDEASIRRWAGVATAIRMFGSDVLVIDIDVGIATIRDAILTAYEQRWPGFMAKCLRRHSGAVKIALIGRCSTVKRYYKTQRYVTTPEDESTHFVEIFTAADKRLVVVQGRHSEGREYGYVGDAIWDRPRDTLPWFPEADLGAAIDLADQIMADHGWQKVIPVIGKEAIGSKVYDLKPEMIFTLSDGGKVTLPDLERDYEAYVMVAARNGGSGKITGYADLWDPDTGSSRHSRTRVIVTIGAEGLCLFDTKYEVRHRWKHRAPPPDDFAERLKALKQQVTFAWEAR